jgi:hypothetical protein
MPVRVWWAKAPAPGNLGDVLTPVILRGLGIEARYAPQQNAQLLAIGSIIRFATRHAVWGSGAMRMTDKPSPKARYLAVRGPLTRDVVRAAGGDCPEVYGDPALLLPLFHNAPVEQKYELGVVPHYRDTEALTCAKLSGLPIAWPLHANPLAVVDRIRSCKAIISSSLHGIIVAHAYGIPAAWLYSPRLNGDGTKFRDYAASVGIMLTPHRTIGSAFPEGPGVFFVKPLIDALEAIR